MKRIILGLLSNMALCMAVVSLSTCSSQAGFQPELNNNLKDQITSMKGGGCD